MVHPLSLLTGVGPKRQELLRESGIHTVEDLIRWAPRDWIDRTKLMPIRTLRPDSDALIRGEVVDAKMVPGKRPRLSVQLSDGTGTLTLLFFHYASGWQQRLLPGSEWIASGRVTAYRSAPQIVHPELEEVKEGEEWHGGILPVYPLTEKMRSARMEQRFLRRAMEQAYSFPTVQLPETLPESLRKEFGFLSEKENLKRLHFPENRGEIAIGLQQLRLSELLPVAIRMARRKELMARRGRALTGGRELLEKMREELPFRLTEGQERVTGEIVTGLEAAQQSHFLLQGDVGSGKTAVALLSAAAAIGAGAQVALMAPTEILIRQHFDRWRESCRRLGMEPALLTGSTPPPERKEILYRLETGQIRLLFGTHALFSSDVKFENLGLCIIDEQHRFGVGQRAALLAKGGDPDLLALSATPIPRSLAMTLYGDLAPVILSEKPGGRQPIQTRLVPEQKRKGMVDWLDRQFRQGVRAYWVVPRIDEREESALLSLEALEGQLRREHPDWKIAAIHGRIPEEEKKRGLDDFSAGKVQLLLATTVIEVGVDVPEATVMVIDGADRFGLAQLHQLRGRVGRGSEESWCFLLTGNDAEAGERLRGFVETEDGFEIAELDLRQRGAGNLEGLTQSGMAQFRWFDFVRDLELIQTSAQFAAEKMAQWETLPEDQRAAYLDWASDDLLETAGNQ